MDGAPRAPAVPACCCCWRTLTSLATRAVAGSSVANRLAIATATHACAFHAASAAIQSTRLPIGRKINVRNRIEHCSAPCVVWYALLVSLFRATVSAVQWLNWGGGSRGISAPPPLILGPPHFTRRSLGYCACLNAPLDLCQLLNHRAPHTKRIVTLTLTPYNTPKFYKGLG